MKNKNLQSGKTQLVLIFLLLSLVCFSAYHSSASSRQAQPEIPAAIDYGRVIGITSAGIELSYSVTEIEAQAGEALTIRYINNSETMHHNIVLVNEENDIRPVGIAALKAHANDYIPEKEMDRIIAYSDLAQPGDTIEFSFTVPPPGIYPYICTYSSHFTMMQGRLISRE